MDFDVKNLDEHELGHLEFVLNSPSWERVFAPYLVKVREGTVALLLQPTADRKSQTPDDFLRGYIAALDGLSHFFVKLIEETSVERMAKSMQRSAEDVYHERLIEGRIGASGQSTDIMDSDDPEEF